MTRKIIIRGTDFLALGLVAEQSLVFGPYDLGTHIVQCHFKTVPGQALPFVPQKYDYVEVTDVDGRTLRFTGKIKTSRRVRVLGVVSNPSYWEIGCQDWAAELQRINVANDISVVAGSNDKHVVESQILTPYWGQIATVPPPHVVYAKSMNLPEVIVTRGQRSVYEALDDIAALAAGVNWYVGPNKELHWNDVITVAPFVLKDGILTGAMGLYRGYADIDDYTDMTGVARRVTVVGSDGFVTDTDWPGYARDQLTLSYERGAPQARTLQLDDVTDRLLSGSSRDRRGFQELASKAERRVLTVRTYDGGLYPGQLVDVIDSDSGTGTVPYVSVDDASMCVPSIPGNLNTGKGRFVVQRMTPRPRGAENWEFVVELGAYLPFFEQAGRL